MIDRLDERWQECKAVIGRRISPEDAATWLPGLQLHAVQPHRIVLGGIPNSFFRSRIVSRFQPLIVEILRERFPEVGVAGAPEFELQVGPASAAAATASAANSTAPLPGASPGNGAARTQRAGAPPHGAATEYGAADAPGATLAAEPWEARFTFAAFLPAPGNAEALAFALDVAAQPGRRYNPLLLVGQSGLGKTHLLQAIAAELRAHGPGAGGTQGALSGNAAARNTAARNTADRNAAAGNAADRNTVDSDTVEGERAVLTVTGEAFKNEVLDGITRKRMPALRERYRAAAALLLDDLEFLLVSPKAQEELLHTFDVLHRAGRQLVFATDRFPRALGGLSPALRSRLEMGLIAELTPPDVGARLALVRQRAAAAGLSLPEDVARLLAERITHNLRRLEGAVVRLVAHAALNGDSGGGAGAAGGAGGTHGMYGGPGITLEFAERYAGPFFDAHPGAAGLNVPREAILEGVADRFGITVRALKGRGRSPNLAGARRVAVHLLKTLAACSYSEIGALLGNRSHSTMVHAHQTLRHDFEQNGHLLAMVQQLSRTVAHG